MNIYNEQDDFANNLFEGKRVIIVGPAGYLDDKRYDKKYAAKIDSFDVVVRFLDALDGLPSVKDKVGSRYDIVISSLSSVFNAVKQIKWTHKGQIMLCPFFLNGYYAKIDSTLGRIKKLSNENELDINMLVRTKESFIDFWKKVNSGPNTGTAAIDYIAQFKIKELHLTGFCFNHFKGRYTKAYKVPNIPPDNGVWHYPKADEAYCNLLIKNNKFITVDDYIKNKILLSDKDLSKLIKELKEKPKGHRYRG